MTWEECKNQIDAWLEEHGYRSDVKIGYIDIDPSGGGGLKIEVVPSYDGDEFWMQVLDDGCSERSTINLPSGEFRYGDPIKIPDGVKIIGEEVRDENDQV